MKSDKKESDVKTKQIKKQNFREMMQVTDSVDEKLVCNVCCDPIKEI